VRESKLASRFHGDVETLCAGCHHHSPVGTRPSPCKSCHEKASHPTEDRPGLFTAYHRQCLGCHQQMGQPQGCTDCHEKKASKEVPT
jgi:predicted CXXCH cytochrome family protein